MLADLAVILAFIGLLRILWHLWKQRFHDSLARALVIRTRQVTVVMAPPGS